AVLGADRQTNRGVAPAHRVDHRIAVLQREIAMPRTMPLEAGNLAAHPDMRKTLLDRALERHRQLGDGILRQIRLQRSGERQIVHRPILTEPGSKRDAGPICSPSTPRGLLRRCAPRNDTCFAVIASEAKRSPSAVALMRILVVGSGGREHALAWAIAASPLVDRVYCAPGNAGIAEEAECVTVAANDTAGLIGFCRKAAIDFVVVGPEAPLVAGLVD